MPDLRAPPAGLMVWRTSHPPRWAEAVDHPDASGLEPRLCSIASRSTHQDIRLEPPVCIGPAEPYPGVCCKAVQFVA